MEITFVIFVKTNELHSSADGFTTRITKTCKDFSDGFQQVYAEVKSLYRNKFPTVEFTLVNIEFL